MERERVFPRPGLEMMEARRRVLDNASTYAPQAAAPGVEHSSVRFSAGPEGLVRTAAEVTALLLRQPGHWGRGYAVVSGIGGRTSIADRRSLHRDLFNLIWADFHQRWEFSSESRAFQISDSITSDGKIPFELFQSNWTFKALHADRDPVLLSHLFGPLNGFSGGRLFLVDGLRYMVATGLRFDDVFVWSDEPIASKPVMREEHREIALRTAGVDLGVLDDQDILFVNNSPYAGVLHGVEPVSATGPDFVRELHRCIACEPIDYRVLAAAGQ